MNQYVVIFITSFICIILYCLFIKNRYGYLVTSQEKINQLKAELNDTLLPKNKRKTKQKKISKLENYINKKSEENFLKAKREFMLIWCYIVILMTNIIYLLLKKFVIINVSDKYDSFDIYSLIIVILMVISSVTMRLLLNDKNIKYPKTKLFTSDDIAFEMTYSYVVAALVVIVSLLLMERYSAAYAWFLILIGKFVWFDSYSLFKIDMQELIKPFKKIDFTVITLLTLALYILTISALNFSLDCLTLIMMTLGITLFIMGIITVIASLILLKLEGNKGGVNL